MLIPGVWAINAWHCTLWLTMAGLFKSQPTPKEDTNTLLLTKSSVRSFFVFWNQFILSFTLYNCFFRFSLINFPLYFFPYFLTIFLFNFFSFQHKETIGIQVRCLQFDCHRQYLQLWTVEWTDQHIKWQIKYTSYNFEHLMMSIKQSKNDTK